jgi:hypothetical protein
MTRTNKFCQKILAFSFSAGLGKEHCRHLAIANTGLPNLQKNWNNSLADLWILAYLVFASTEPPGQA